MVSRKSLRFVVLLAVLSMPLLLSDIALAQEVTGGGVAQVENFIRNVIKVVAGLSGLVATFFFVVGGYTYITSSGNPEKLEKAKDTLKWSAIGLVIVFAAFIISSIVTELATSAFGN